MAEQNYNQLVLAQLQSLSQAMEALRGDLQFVRQEITELKAKEDRVVELKEAYVIKWLSYNKEFFMEHESSVFRELNEDYLLTEMSYNRDYMADIVILSKAGHYEVG